MERKTIRENRLRPLPSTNSSIQYERHYIVLHEEKLAPDSLEPELSLLLRDAVQRTGLSKSEVLRQGLRKGIPEVISALGTPPRRTVIHALLEMTGLTIPERRHRMSRRAA